MAKPTDKPDRLNVTGLFAGIGGIELGLHRAGHSTLALCESWEPAQAVLKSLEEFAGVPIHADVTDLSASDIPRDTDLITAGFPCTDLSQAGRTAGLKGDASGLVLHVLDMLAEMKASRRELPSLLLENVANMLVLGKGEAMTALINCLNALGYRWAYRVVDSRCAGLPQRRRRIYLLASTRFEPRDVLLADDHDGLAPEGLADNAYGFYWTEGRTGLGWAQDAVPTLKGGSSLGIPSPPAVWLTSETDPSLAVVKPTIEAAEVLQGFRPGHTLVTANMGRNGPRWKLVGNAVTVDIAQWIGERLASSGDFDRPYAGWSGRGKWPAAAYGDAAAVYAVEIGEFPIASQYRHLADVLRAHGSEPLSHRAAAGFWSRLEPTNLGRHPGFRAAIANFVESVDPQSATSQTAA